MNTWFWTRRRAGWLPVLLVTGVLAAACGGAEDDTGVGGSESTAERVATATVTPTPTPTASPDVPGPTGRDTAAENGAADSQAAAALAGEAAPAPAADSTMSVVGVAADDVLNVREVPGTGGGIVAELAPLADDVTVTGRGRRVDGGIWYEVEPEGWVNARYLAHLGDVTDITSELTERPSATSMAGLADAVAGLRTAGVTGEGGPRVVISDGPTVDDLGEVTIDVTGLPDDAVAGERLHIFAHVLDDGFELRTVERTLLCARGVSDGLCS